MQTREIAQRPQKPPSIIAPAPLAPMRVIRRAALDHQADGPTRGWAHIGFEDHPAQAPGHLDFDPLVLFGEGHMLGGEGFAMHPHEGVENLLLILSGQMHHRGSDGSDWILGPDDLFLMSAGSGGEHAEHVYGDEPVHALVIWLRSAEADAPCRFDRASVAGTPGEGFAVLASGGTRTGGLAMRRDAALLRADLGPLGRARHEIEPGRRGYAIILGAAATLGDQVIEPGDRVMIDGPGVVEFQATDAARVILVDMA